MALRFLSYRGNKTTEAENEKVGVKQWRSKQSRARPFQGSFRQ